MAWSQEQLQNAAIIAQVGRSLGASDRDIQIAIMTAIVESGLRNLNYGDRDSIGMFQQRDAWGSHSDRLDPHKSARMFFLGGAQGQRGLLDFDNRNSMGMGEAAQAVQVSAFPDRYAEQEQAAAGILRSIGENPVAPTAGTLGALTSESTVDVQAPVLGDLVADEVTEVNGVGEVTADASGIGELSFDDSMGASSLDALTFDGATPAPPEENPMGGLLAPSLEDLGVDTDTVSGLSGKSNNITDFAQKFLGTPYVWGGTSPTGFDCSGFVQYVYKHFGVDLPRISADQARAGRRIGLGDLRPGDLVALDNSSRNNGADHIGIYLGNGQIIHAPRPGSAVEIAGLNDVFGGGWGIRVNY